MVDWNALEAAGHDLTHCGMLMPGTSLYSCENCGAFMLTRHEGIEVFHLPSGAVATQQRCYGLGRASPRLESGGWSLLKDKLEALRAADYERLKGSR